MRLLRYSGLWDFLGYGYWALEERVSGTYVGQLGFADFKRPITGVDLTLPEAGWTLHPDFAGRGYATEAMQAACHWLDTETPHAESFCIIAPENTRSIHLAEKLGYVFVTDTSFNDEPTAYYRRARSS